MYISMLSIDTYYCISGRDPLRQEKTHEDQSMRRSRSGQEQSQIQENIDRGAYISIQ